MAFIFLVMVIRKENENMKREFLEELGIEKEVIDKILEESGKDVEKYKKQAENSKNDNTTLQNQLKEIEQKFTELQNSAGNAEELKKQLETMQQNHKKETEEFQKQIAERDYKDAMKYAIEKSNIKFTSEMAKRAYLEELQKENLTVKEGNLEGFEQFHKKQLEADPNAFVADKPQEQKPYFMPAMGSSGNTSTPSLGVAYAQKFNNTLGLQRSENK